MSSLRSLSRLARRVPVVKGAIEASDPRRRAERLAGLGIVDADLYAAQLGVDSISADEAARHYASTGYLLGYTLNVLTDPYVVRRGMIRTNRPALYDYFNSAAWHIRTSGVWSAPAYSLSNPEALEHPAGPVGHLWERVRRDPQTKVEIEPGGAREFTWSDIYPVLASATVQWAENERDRRKRYPRAALDHPAFFPQDDLPVRDSLISIIMPVWNRGGSMRSAVDSVLAQTWKNWELLIVDDGSWDDTIDVAELLARRDGRIRVIRQDHRGVCAARNLGIENARGEYLAFLDSDNTWLPNFLHDMGVAMTRDDLTTAYATIEVRDGTRTQYRYGSPDRKSLLNGNSIDMNTLVARRDAVMAVGAFDASLRRAVDYDLILKLAEFGPISHVETLGAVYDNSEAARDRISISEPFGWNTEVRLRHTRVEKSSMGSTVTVANVIQRHDPALASKLPILAEMDTDFDVSIVGVGLKPDEWRQIRACAFGHENISTRLHPRGEAFPYVVNVELRRSSSKILTVIEPRSIYTQEGLQQLIDEVASGSSSAAIPLTLDPSGSIEGLGVILAGPQNVPVPAFGSHPAEDARRLGSRVRIAGLSGRSMAIDRGVLEKIGGLDPLLHNEHELAGLTAKLSEYTLTACTDVTFSQLGDPLEFDITDERGTSEILRDRLAEARPSNPDALYSQLDMRVAHWGVHTPPVSSVEDDRRPPRETLVPIVVREHRTTTVKGRVVPKLRWAVKTSSPAGPSGELWGDTHFARSLVAALETLGQEASVDPRESHHRRTSYLDDVVINLRGLDEYVPSRGSLSYLWIISHPDMVSRAEVSRYDRVFAASLSWSKDASSRWGRPIEPLLQCTDPGRFYPSSDLRHDRNILFVGKSRGMPRATVMESVRAGIPVDIYGPDWERLLPPEALRGEGVPNTELGAMYERASVVLNDHWSDMQREGFVSNRLFDIVAAGGRAYSDAVVGIDEIFSGGVRTYSTVSEIAPFLSGDFGSQFPAQDELAAISARIREEHSFVARARVLLDRAIADLEQRDRA